MNIKAEITYIKPLWLKLITIAALILTMIYLSKNIQDIILSIINNITAALIFEVIHRYNQNKKNIKILNSLINSLLEGFANGSIFQHEKSILYVENYLTLNKVNNLKRRLEDYEFYFLDVKSTIETAHSRFSDFKTALIIASQVSAEHSNMWFAITDKVRLLVDEYQKYISIKEKNIFLGKLILLKDKKYSDMNPTEQLVNSFVFRFQEFLELAENLISVKC